MQLSNDSNDLGFLMALTNDTVMLFLLLMPGFIASIILNAIIVRKPPDGLKLVIEALAFSFVIYVCWAMFTGQFFIIVGASGVMSLGEISRTSLAGIMVLSIVFPLLLGVLQTHDYLLRFLGWLGVTRRTGRGSAWLDVFVEQRQYVIVTFTDGRHLYGWPEFYSDDANEGMLYLSSPRWLTGNEKGALLIPLEKMRGVLVVKREVIESIAFTNIGYDNVESGEYDEKAFLSAYTDHRGPAPSCLERTKSTSATEEKASSVASSTSREEVICDDQIKE